MAKEWIPPVPPPPRLMGTCPDCGAELYDGDLIWWMPEKTVCYDPKPCWIRYAIEDRGMLFQMGLERFLGEDMARC